MIKITNQFKPYRSTVKREYMKRKIDKKGLYYMGEFKTGNFTDAVKELYEMMEIPSGFCVDESYKAFGYSVVDSRGVQHIYELSPSAFYAALMNLD